MVSPLTRDLSTLATHRRSWIVSHAQNACFDALDEGGPIFGMALRFGLHQLREIAHVSLTALARSVQRTGFYVRSLDTLTLGGALTILTGMTSAMHDLVVRTHCTCRLHPNSKSCI